MKVPLSIFPSLVTAGNLFCGFYAVICAFQIKIELSAWFIIASAVLDAVDGKVARLTKSSSRFGVEYDSLADVVSFGLAPSILMYILFADRLGFIATSICFLPLLCGSIRLARFNVQLEGFDKDHFVGLPIPIAAITLSSFVLFSLHFYDTPLYYPFPMLLLIVTVSGLMVSTIRYMIMPSLSFQGTWQQKRITIIIGIIAILIILFPRQILFPLSMVYILSGLVWLFGGKNSGLNNGDSPVESKS